MKRFLTYILIPLTLCGCYIQHRRHLEAGVFYINNYSEVVLDKENPDETTYKIEEGYLEFSVIDEDTYYKSNRLNTVKSYLPDDDGNYYFSIKCRVKFQNYSYWDVDFYDQKDDIARMDTYLFLLKIDNEEMKCDFTVALDVSAYEFSILPYDSPLPVNYKNYYHFLFRIGFNRQ